MNRDDTGTFSSLDLQPASSDLEEIVSRATSDLERLSGKRVAVTGAAGFLGSYLCHAIALASARGVVERCTLVCVDSFATGTPGRLHGLEARGDRVLLTARVEELAALDADMIVHAASIASPAAYRTMPLETIAVNVLGTLNLLKLARAAGVESFLYLSSSEVYGDPEDAAIPTPEGYVGRVSFTGPRACYDESKRMAETLCRVYYEQYRLPVKVARPFNVYGPGLRLDDGRIIPDLMRQAFAGGPLVLYSDGTPTRSFCYVTDAIVALVALLVSHHDGEAFNVGNPEEVSIAEVARLTAELSGVREVRREVPGDPRYLADNPRRRCPDIGKITARLPWRPQVGLREGLARTVRYYATAVAAR